MNMLHMFGLYEDDLLQDGELVEEWVECSGCKKWMHGQCVRLDNQDLLACCLCGTVLCSCNSSCLNIY